MATRADQEVLIDLMDATGLPDGDIAKLLGVHQTTVWRLRRGRIVKKGRYIAALRGHLAGRGVGPSPDADATGLRYLATIAKQSSHLRTALQALALFLQENA